MAFRSVAFGENDPPVVVDQVPPVALPPIEPPKGADVTP